MSYDQYVHVAVGCLVPNNKVYREVEVPASGKDFCSDSACPVLIQGIHGKFCSECGKSTESLKKTRKYMEYIPPFDQWDEENDDASTFILGSIRLRVFGFHNYAVNDMFMGLEIFKSITCKETDDRLMLMQFNDLEKVKDTAKTMLEQVGFYDEKTFGVWLVTEVW